MEDSDASRVHRLRIAYASAINRVTPERGQSRGDGAHTRTSAAHWDELKHLGAPGGACMWFTWLACGFPHSHWRRWSIGWWRFT